MQSPYRMTPQITAAAGEYVYFTGGVGVVMLEWLCGGTAGSVSVYDAAGKPAGRCVAKLQAVANGADRITYSVKQCMSFTNGIYIVATQVGEFAAYAQNNPVGP